MGAGELSRGKCYHAPQTGLQDFGNERDDVEQLLLSLYIRLQQERLHLQVLEPEREHNQHNMATHTLVRNTNQHNMATHTVVRNRISTTWQPTQWYRTESAQHGNLHTGTEYKSAQHGNPHTGTSLGREVPLLSS